MGRKAASPEQPSAPNNRSSGAVSRASGQSAAVQRRRAPPAAAGAAAGTAPSSAEAADAADAPTAPQHHSSGPWPLTATERSAYLCCALVSLCCLGVAAAELILVFHHGELGLGQQCRESIEGFAGGAIRGLSEGRLAVPGQHALRARRL